ncbi:cilia- and flagella-associated protein 74 [Ptiloglossa arizonensis]|uniref:cilia- and flagella-associated protein 74 n=1 Tax=Ptiloglossa arizonensis TaxID=3350558 RepID=UPI003FA0DFCD
MVDSDVCQQSFKIVNTGRSSVQVFTKTPKCLRNQVTIHPKSTIIQPETFSTISLRLIPKSTILRLSKRFYDPNSSMLEFPVHVHTVSRDTEKPPPIVLKTLASLTTCRGLVLGRGSGIKPANIDLGYVHTHESVYTELTLTNDSLLIQEYGFVNLPLFMEVQPNHGFGSILPGETIKLHLIYSGCLTDIPGNEIGSNGLTENVKDFS